MSRLALLVEDDDSIALIVETVLTADGHQVRRAADGATALAIAADTAPALIVTDLNLPGGINGADLVRTLRQELPTLPAVLISGEYDDDATPPPDLPHAACLAKPFRRAALLTAIATAQG
ncbi:CheY-like response regulator [Neoasaia chiangmaiensis NBRC 101099]|uniref:Uncharacterized protein n=1 Tax=Neoasaia chiangmaiensis TaxID=320497 RepID=A0A1U9KS42_9PROT|nr:response regulator [Neoasaia chiangmaiensis]AQS88582.1 hypothetical protein A0U93_12255 [Neoasaia chiangmaiensis]GBR36229.1 CheY-like response regulator [Neoasaia chiangmaiensis NBRC 101099]GEN15425.1 hypothetical protein NCH01_18560 [Neoasaia chiangmaiensis]